MAEIPNTTSKKSKAAANIFILMSVSLNIPLFQLSRKRDLMKPLFLFTFFDF